MRIRQLRGEHGLFRKELAEKIGLSVSAIARYEAETVRIRAGTLIRHADFGVSVDYLLELTNELRMRP